MRCFFSNVYLYLILIIVVRHKIFERKNNDLFTNFTITLQDTLNDFETSFLHFDGHNVRDHLTNIVYMRLSIKCFFEFFLDNNQT